MLAVKPSVIAVVGGCKLLSDVVAPNCEFHDAKLTVTHNFRVLPLQSHDIILGYDWFAQVSPIAFNVPENTFSFTLHGKQTVTTTIFSRLEIVKEAPAEELSRMLDKGAKGFLITNAQHCFASSSRI